MTAIVNSFTEKIMTLIKYYNTNTCYDGTKEFAYASQISSRHYPDEYLIVNILKKFHKHSFPNAKILILAEPWSTDSKILRDGGKNTYKFNELIIQEIDKLSKEDENTLILAPFLYGYHHPGIAIDVKNRLAIYLDPFGTAPQYEEAKSLKQLLEKKLFKFSIENTKQQTDSVSCGPILTASMIRFMQAFVESKSISTGNFPAQRRDLATIRIHQMVINNCNLPQIENVVDEVMLADEELWKEYASEQNLSLGISKKITDEIQQQKTFIKSLPTKWQEDDNLKNIVNHIVHFQFAIYQNTQLRNPNLFQIIEKLSHNLKEMITKGNSIIEEGEFEKKKKVIQEQFISHLNELKVKLTELAKKDDAQKEKGLILFDSFNTKQEEFFRTLDFKKDEHQLTTQILHFRDSCAENLKITDEIMGHGWLYRITEVLIKAVVGLFAGFGMVIGSLFGQGLAKSEHRVAFAKTFFTLNQTEESKCLSIFKEKILGDSELNQGLLSVQKLK